MRRLDGQARIMPRPNCRPGEKRCGTCRLWKSLEAFHNSSKSHDGKGTRCKPCDKVARKQWREANPQRARESARWKNIMNAHGLTKEQWMAMYNEQEGVCKICQMSQDERGYDGRSLCVDHNHQSGEVRGLLCNGCNRALGFFLDSPDLLRQAANYLENQK